MLGERWLHILLLDDSVARRNDSCETKKKKKRGALFFLTPNTESSAWKQIKTPVGNKRGCETTRTKERGEKKQKKTDGIVGKQQQTTFLSNFFPLAVCFQVLGVANRSRKRVWCLKLCIQDAAVT